MHNQTTIRRIVSTSTCLLLGVLAKAALAAEVTYQGLLSDPNGPVNDTIAMRF